MTTDQGARTPVDVDPDLARTDWNPRMWAIIVPIAGLMDLFLTTIARRWTTISPVALWSLYLAWAVVYGASTFGFGAERMVTPRLWPIRLLGLIVAVAMTSGFGAAAHDPASPAYGALLAGASMLGRTWRGLAPAIAFLTLPLVVRIAFVPDASAFSMLVAVGFSAAGAVLYWYSSQPSAELARTALAIDAARALASIARESADNMRVAMSLHDGLSGALYAARRRLKSADDGCAREISTSLLAQARRVISPRVPAGDAEEISSTLERTARVLGVESRVRVHGRAGADASELRDALEIASELLGNSAKHGCDDRIDIEIDLRVAHVRAVMHDEGGGAWDRSGRGLRNMELRARMRTGALAIERSGADVVVTAWWPTIVTSVPWWRSRPLFVQMAFVALATLPLVFHGSSIIGVSVTAIAIVFTVLAVRSRERTVIVRRMELAAAVEARRASEQSEVLALVDESCGQALDGLTRATADGTGAEIRAAVGELDGRVRDLLFALESTGSGTVAERYHRRRANAVTSVS